MDDTHPESPSSDADKLHGDAATVYAMRRDLVEGFAFLADKIKTAAGRQKDLSHLVPELERELALIVKRLGNVTLIIRTRADMDVGSPASAYRHFAEIAESLVTSLADATDKPDEPESRADKPPDIDEGPASAAPGPQETPE